MQNTTQQPKENMLERIAKMEALYHDLMEQYQGIVLPWGLGHGMPEEESNKATETMNHACAVLEKLHTMMDEAGVNRQLLPAPKGNAQLMQQHANTPEFRESIAIICGLTELEFTERVLAEAIFFLQENDPKREDTMIGDIAFIGWVMTRLHPVCVSVAAIALHGEKDKMILRAHLCQGIERRFASYETYQNYLFTFPKTK